MMAMYNEAELLWRQMSPEDWQVSVVLDAFEDYVNGALCQWERVLGHLRRDEDLKNLEREDMKRIQDLVEAAYVELKSGQEAVDRDREEMMAVQEIVPKTYQDVRRVQEAVERVQEDVNRIQELMQKTRENLEEISGSRSKVMAARRDVTTMIFLDVSFYLTSIRKVRNHLDHLAEKEPSLVELSQSLQPKFQPFEEALVHLESSEVKGEDRYLMGSGDISISGNTCTYSFNGKEIDLGTGMEVVREAYEGVMSAMRSRLSGTGSE